MQMFIRLSQNLLSHFESISNTWILRQCITSKRW